MTELQFPTNGVDLLGRDPGRKDRKWNERVETESESAEDAGKPLPSLAAFVPLARSVLV